MKYIAIFHANLNYAYLTEDRYEFVIRSAYELILETMNDCFPGTKFVFEASGYTLEQIEQKTPDVLEKLKRAIANGPCEFMGSPYAHPMLPNYPFEDGLWSIRFSNEVYERLLGIQPGSFWNPECGWSSVVPEQVLAAGYANLIGDFEAYSRSCGPDGRPLRPEIYAREASTEAAFYNFGFQYDLPGTERTIHFPFSRLHGAPEDSLRLFLRTDRIAQYGVRYFMGMPGYSFENYLDLIQKYSQQPEGEPEGALIIFADDAEYIGTNGWFRLKYQNQPDCVFEATPASREKLIALVTAVGRFGEFTTFSEACRQLSPLAEEAAFDEDSAWHGARASTWASTPMARLLRPWQEAVRQKLVGMEPHFDEDTRRLVWYYLTNSYNSDGQWPPTLVDAPHIVHPFNYAYCFDNLLKAELLVGGIRREDLDTDPAGTLRTILSPQQERVLAKAGQLLDSDDPETRDKARQAQILVERTQDVASVCQTGSRLLYPSEYRIRADALVEARRLVGGILIE